MSRRRHKVSRRGSKRLFKVTASKMHKKNFVQPNRGGLRM